MRTPNCTKYFNNIKYFKNSSQTTTITNIYADSNGIQDQSTPLKLIIAKLKATTKCIKIPLNQRR